MPKDSAPKLHLFGEPRLEKSGKPLEFARRKTFDLLAYLALHPAEQTREKAAAALWMDASEESSRLSLRVAISDLRKTLGESCLAETSGLQLNPKLSLWVDAREFQRLADSRAAPEDWLAALELCAGEFLPRRYEDWAVEWREDFEHLRVETNYRLAQYRRAQGQFSLAVESARVVLAADPSREAAHLVVIASLEALGDRDAALDQYAACVKALNEAGLEPSPETQVIQRRIQKMSEAAASAPPSNLPRPITSFIGREEELNEIETLLTQTRLLTLTGAGGSGKTRLAIQAADESAHNYPDGAWWVELAPLADGNLLPQTIARVFGVKEKGGADPLDQVAIFIGERKLLLVLDNCEHLLADCARVIRLLVSRCPALTLLATSRTPLGLDGEAEWPTPTLPLPEADSHFKALQKNEAVRLFAERARSANSSFQINAQNAPRAAELCRRLDGIPLAIELAAAQMGNLSLEGILARLGNFLDLDSESHAPRHATLRAAIQWSYDLLNPVERLLFNRLAVFAGGWTVQAAVTAAGYTEEDVILSAGAVDEDFPPLPVTGEMVTRQTLESLTRKALIQTRHTETGMRYDMLDTIREFGRDTLRASGEIETAQEKHARFFFDLLETLWNDIYTERENAALNRVEQEQANLRLAWAAWLSSPEWRAGRYALACQSRFWYSRGNYSEGRESLHRWLAHPSMQAAEAARGELFNCIGLVEWPSGNFSLARDFFLRGRDDYRALNMDREAAMCLINAGSTYVDEENFDEAQSLLEQGLELARATQHERAIAIGLNNLANALTAKRDFPRARAALEESIGLRRKMGDLRGLGINLNNLGDVEAEEENYARARELYMESFEIRAQLGDRRGAVIAALNLVKLMQMESKLEEAARLLGFTDEALEKMGIQMPKDAREFREQAAAELRAALGEEAYRAANQSGRALTLETAAGWLKSL